MEDKQTRGCREKCKGVSGRKRDLTRKTGRGFVKRLIAGVGCQDCSTPLPLMNEAYLLEFYI